MFGVTFLFINLRSKLLLHFLTLMECKRMERSNFMTRLYAKSQSPNDGVRRVALAFHLYKLSLVVRKPVFGVSDLVRHKPGCIAIEDG